LASKNKGKISYRIPLFWAIFLLLILLFLGFFLQGYLNFKLIQSQSSTTDVSSIFFQFLFSDIFFFCLVAFCFFILFKTIIQPVKKLENLCERISLGEPVTTEIIESDIQEVYDLIVAFKKMIEDLKKNKTALEEANQVLEIKVKARTKELEELTANLEEKVKERTKELREKMANLEKFHNLTIGRELKMVELKKEIERLKEEVKKNKEKNKNL